MDATRPQQRGAIIAAFQHLEAVGFIRLTVSYYKVDIVSEYIEMSQQ
jgi:hypothetical protein